ncbi:glutathione S-transferase family protein [Paradevosia shaoguanensis]|uniref:glutathione S-transferase family protein n=1 Tax=Paradevosia shaoguanensis TaxID=1335043 RepID=UPI003C7404EB
MKLYFSRNYNPRLAVATARYLGVPVEFEFASPFDPVHIDHFRALNPNHRIPILLEDDGTALWEADAIACRLSRLAGSTFWRTGAMEPRMLQWLSWANGDFVAGCDKVHFERVTRQRYGHGPIRTHYVEDGLALFHQSAAILDAHLANQDWLLEDGISYADFRAACVLPFADIAGLPVADYRNVTAWLASLSAIEAWNDPFVGLEAPALPAPAI